MSGALKAGLVLLPFLAIFLLLRSCQGGDAGRWLAHFEAGMEDGTRFYFASMSAPARLIGWHEQGCPRPQISGWLSAGAAESLKLR